MFSGACKIFTLDDLSQPKTLEELARDSCKKISVFTYQDKVTVGLVDRVVLVGESGVYSIMLDDDSYLKVTGDQEFILRNGEVTKCTDLKCGDSLMPLYISYDRHGYPLYKENSDHNLINESSIDRRRVRKVSRMVAEYKVGVKLQEGTYVNHINENRKNCNPDNLSVEVKKTKTREILDPYIRALKEAKEFIDLNGNNHKVKEVLVGEPEPVYRLIYSSLNNVAISGVFLKLDECE